MTVGQRLAALTGFQLFHNHQVIDLLTPYFEFGSDPFERLSTEYRRQFFGEAAAANLGLITTWGWRFDVAEDLDWIEQLFAPFLDANGRVSFLELAASLEVRLKRNHTENRRANKRTEWATEEVIAERHRRHENNSGDRYPFPWPDLHLKVDNSQIDPEEVAALAQAHFRLPSAG